MKEELWLIWKEPISRRRYKIGSLLKNNNNYVFSYIDPELESAKAAGFKCFPGFEILDKVYESKSLFANILTRLPNKARPDYLDILNCYNLNKDSSDFDILRATRGRLFTDNYELVPAFDLNRIEFDVAGTNYSRDINNCKKLLEVNKSLYLEPEDNNPMDENAIKIIFKDDTKTYHLGYVPRYYSKELLKELNKGVKYSAMIQNLKLESEISDEVITASVKIIFDENV